MTLVFLRHAQVGSHHFEHGQELPPGLLPAEVINHWLDERWLKAYDSTERRSLYRLFAPLSGCQVREPFSQKELELYALGE
jgi:hypothetical protein